MKTYDEATKVSKQITKPCKDCPFLRTSIPGWLGGQKPEDYCQMAHSDDLIECHTKQLQSKDLMHCAGAAIYRANVIKRAEFQLPQNTKSVFSTPIEFLEHHARKKLTPGKIRKMMLAAFGRRLRRVQDANG